VLLRVIVGLCSRYKLFLAGEVEDLMFLDFQTILSFSLVCDGWTSIASMCYFAIIIYWIGEDHHMKKAALRCVVSNSELTIDCCTRVNNPMVCRSHHGLDVRNLHASDDLLWFAGETEFACD
jgi:hypothetical protein